MPACISSGIHLSCSLLNSHCSALPSITQHVAMADEAFCIGPPPARESYLRGDRILEVCLAWNEQ